MFNIKKKEYNNWLFLLKNHNSSNVQHFTFFHPKYTKNYNWKEFSLLCLKNNLHKISKFYLLNLNKTFYSYVKGSSIYYSLLDLNNINNLLKNFDFLFILIYNKMHNLFLFYVNKNLKLNTYNLNKSLLLNLRSMFIFNISLLKIILVSTIKLFIFKNKNDFVN